MDPEQDRDYIFDMIKAVKHFYETPVVFFTKNDYSDNVFNTLCTMRTALLNDCKNSVIDEIADFHLNWFHAVNDIENFLKRLNDTPRDDIYQAVSYTIDAITYRLKYFQRYIEKNRKLLSNEEQSNVMADMEIIEDMHKHVTHDLLEILKCFRNFTSANEFIIKVKWHVDELLHFLDKIYDELAFTLSKYLHFHVPQLKTDLTKTLQQIVDELHFSKSSSAQMLLDQLKLKGKELSSMLRCTAGHKLEISKVWDKINVLEDRIKRLEHEPTSAALMALQHKKEYLEKRLSSLEDLRLTLKSFHNLADLPLEPEEELCVCEDFYQLRVFNHALPADEREHLISDLCHLWDLAVFGDRSHKSMISILSAADMKEEFTDEHGTFFIDEYSRKIYKLENDDTHYQPNEFNQLVPVSDDADHVYFFDECGRYFIDQKSRQRIYKAHATASEYLMDSTGLLLKLKEERDGVTYHYDHCGRYYINDEGKHIYREADTISEYEQDGLGNLVRIRSQMDIFEPCPDDAHVTDEFKYLKQTVGRALRESIADVILHQPQDPIKYLSMRLIKFRENLELQERRATEKDELNIEREIRFAEERAAAERAALEAALLAQGGSEASYDSNLLKYTTMQQEDVVSVGASSK